MYDSTWQDKTKSYDSCFWLLMLLVCVGRSHALWAIVVPKLDVGSTPGVWRLSDASARWNIDSESWSIRRPWAAFGQYTQKSVKVQSHTTATSDWRKVWFSATLRLLLHRPPPFTFHTLSREIKVWCSADIFIHISFTQSHAEPYCQPFSLVWCLH